MPRFTSLFCALFLAACAQLPPAEIPSAPQTRAQVVVLDIDGTLTPEDWAFAEVRPAAAQTVTAYSAKGYTIVYLSVRIPGLQQDLPGWLDRNGFPRGTLHVAQTSEERNDAGAYKSAVLTQYVKQGWRLAYAYGDSWTDFQAYASAGMPKERVFALRRRSQQNCQPGVYKACLDGWQQQPLYVEREVPNAQ
jgi:phosphatidate phosphatase PAH1